MSLKILLSFFVKHHISTDYHLLVVWVVQLVPFRTWIIIDEDESLTLVIRFCSSLAWDMNISYTPKNLQVRDTRLSFTLRFLWCPSPIHFLLEIDWTDKLHMSQLLPKIILAFSCFWACFEPYQGSFYFLFPPHHSVGGSWNRQETSNSILFTELSELFGSEFSTSVSPHGFDLFFLHYSFELLEGGKDFWFLL